MNNRPITDIVKFIRSFRSDDRLRRAIGVMQVQTVPAAPVIDDGRLLGMLSEAGALAYLAAHPTETEASVADAMDREPVFGNVHMPLEMVAEVMTSAKVDVLPIVDEFGGYRGAVTRSELLAALMDIVKPPSIAGLATPIGVRLTTGGATAGAGSFALFLAGASMAAFFGAAMLVVFGIAMLIDAVFKTPLTHLLLSPSTGTTTGHLGADLANTIALLPMGAVWLLLLRLSPMASFHAAEHQVVHTIEAGEPLTPESVARFPRAHPRCGTNLMAAIGLMYIVMTVIGLDYAVPIALVLLLTGWWRTLGYYLQQYFTTKPAGPRYIQNGIKVGEELLAKVKRGEANQPSTGLAKIWNMGLPQVLLGLLVTGRLVIWLALKLHFGIF